MEKVTEEGSLKGVIEACVRGSDTEADSPKINTSGAEIHSSNSQEISYWRTLFKLWKRSTIKRIPDCRTVRENVDGDFCYFKSCWKNFAFSDLQSATNNFNQENLIGKGGHAEVYKGCLPDGQVVAIKRLNKGTPEEQIIGFLTEIGIIAHVNHPNTAKLIGYGVEGGTYLVLQLSPLGSLGSYLCGSKEKLDWSIRYKIILGTAAGLLYLHEKCQRRIIHRDIKADNILLTEDFEPQICDFGLAKWLPKEWTHYNVPRSEGTFGYFAPEYFMHGVVDEKTDVFSFGVLLLELISGCKALDDSKQSLVLWAKPLLKCNSVKQLVDPSLHDSYDAKQMARVILTASLCIEQNPVLRPRMSQVVVLLRGESSNPMCSKDSKDFKK
ncbi:Non-specific serine/threonine protein kinase [Bertholletia excelsa]